MSWDDVGRILLIHVLLVFGSWSAGYRIGWPRRKDKRDE